MYNYSLVQRCIILSGPLPLLLQIYKKYVHRFAQISLYYLIISSVQQVERLSLKGIDFSRELDQTCCIAQFHFLIAFHCKILLYNPLLISINTVLIFYHKPYISDKKTQIQQYSKRTHAEPSNVIHCHAFLCIDQFVYIDLVIIFQCILAVE